MAWRSWGPLNEAFPRVWASARIQTMARRQGQKPTRSSRFVLPSPFPQSTRSTKDRCFHSSRSLSLSSYQPSRTQCVRPLLPGKSQQPTSRHVRSPATPGDKGQATRLAFLHPRPPSDTAIYPPFPILPPVNIGRPGIQGLPRTLRALDHVSATATMTHWARIQPPPISPRPQPAREGREISGLLRAHRTRRW